MRLVLALALVACTDPVQPVPAPRDPRTGSQHAVAPADAAPSRGFVGVITAAESVDIAPRFQGVVRVVNVRAGDAVVKDQVVAEMDPKSMQEELRAAEAAYNAAAAARRQADVDVEDARRKLRLETKAVADGVSPRTNLEEAQLAVKRAEAAASKAVSTVAAESSHVQTARDHLTDTALRAPSDGTVAFRYKDPGATVAAGVAIVRIVGHGGLRLRFAVPPDDARSLAVNAKVEATVDTIAGAVPAVVRQISPAIDPASGLIFVEAELQADDKIGAQLRPGLAAWVK